jgi:spore coat protein CotH
MLIKKAGATGGLWKALRKGGALHALQRRWFFVAATLFGLTAFALAGMYYGMVLVRTGQSVSLNAWVTGLARTRFGVIANYLDGLTAVAEHLEIDIKFKDYQKLVYKREEALHAGYLDSGPDDWVPAQIRHRGRVYRVRLRLKGDEPDHWKRQEMWSFKVKVRGDETFLGMKRFALQHPQTRNYMNEWVIQRLQRHLGLISLRYDFVDVVINGKHQPIYALEENFEKRLIENNNRREGPIFRYDQAFYWAGKPGMSSELAGSSIRPYQEGKTLDDPALTDQFHIARSLLELFRRGDLPASKVFDPGKLASFFALTDLVGFHHATQIDNLKFYYNPVTSLVEPVGYDFNLIEPLEGNEALIAARIVRASSEEFDTSDWRAALFQDETFYRHYLKALEMVSDEGFLRDFFASVQDEYEDKLAVLHKSFPYYNFRGREVLYANQAYIRDFFSPTRGLQAYLQDISPGRGELVLTVSNIHSLPMELIRVESREGDFIPAAGEAVVSPVPRDAPVRYASVSFVSNGDPPALKEDLGDLLVHYRLYGTDGENVVRVYPWSPAKTGFLDSDIMRQPPNVGEFEFMAVNEEAGRIDVLPGTWQVDRNMMIPEGYVVAAGSGVHLDLVNNAVVVSRSALRFRGSEEDPIVIRSSDSSGQGLVVMRADRESVLEEVRVEGLASPSQEGWELTGAVTFYESPVRIIRSRFEQNRGEDSLNVIRSRFEIESTFFVSAASDAFDADFCTGRILNTSFVDCGNDGVDVSGSIVELDNVTISGAGDKGISAGERSRLQLNRVTVRDTEIAIASKDDSNIVARDIEIVDSRVGFAVFRKKPEFGGAVITADGTRIERVSLPYLVEKGSSLSVDGRLIEPGRRKVEDILYGVEYGKAGK